MSDPFSEFVAAMADAVAEAVIDRLRSDGGLTKPKVERLAYSVAEAADALGMAESTVRDRIKDGTIRTARIGGRVLIHRSELDRLLLGDRAAS
jgi:excisionase family DNA binding protein